MYERKTRGIAVRVEPRYCEERSAPGEGLFVWTYEIEIENGSTETVQLISRHWTITDSAGQVREVTGDGVVGEQPVLKPGETFSYESGAPLETPSGVMFGSYEMQTAIGENLTVDIPAFSLDSPYETARARPH